MDVICRLGLPATADYGTSSPPHGGGYPANLDANGRLERLATNSNVSIVSMRTIECPVGKTGMQGRNKGTATGNWGSSGCPDRRGAH
jgi:hypothetical protein